NYKELLNKSKRSRRKKGGRGAKTRQSALLADLGKANKPTAGNGEEEEGENTEEATPAPSTSTRPRRAAAPVFGEAAKEKNGAAAAEEARKEAEKEEGQ